LTWRRHAGIDDVRRDQKHDFVALLVGLLVLEQTVDDWNVSETRDLVDGLAARIAHQTANATLGT